MDRNISNGMLGNWPAPAKAVILLLFSFLLVSSSELAAQTTDPVNSVWLVPVSDKAIVPIVFVFDNEKFKSERNLVRRLTNIAESEARSEGALKSAQIGISLFDLNGDGVGEIFAYIIQEEWCTGAGDRCSFVVFSVSSNKSWKNILDTTFYQKGIGVLSSGRNSFRDVIFNEFVPDSGFTARQIIYRWNQSQYRPYQKSEKITENNAPSVLLMRWDKKQSRWLTQ